MKRCQICKVQAELVDGRWRSCRMAKEATDHHMTYGKYVAMVTEKRQKAPRKPKTIVEEIPMTKCAYCGKEFPKKGVRIYCSDYCKQMQYYANKRAKEAPLEARECPVCRKIFIPDRGNKKYCSDACGRSHMARKIRKREKGEDKNEHLD